VLSFAILGGYKELVEFLLKRGAPVRPYSLQLLSLAARDGRLDLMDLLIQHHAPILALGGYYFLNTYDLNVLRYLLEHGSVD
jgi:ankyrin repeat protein